MNSERAHLHGGFFHHPLFNFYFWIFLVIAVGIAMIIVGTLVNNGGGSTPYPSYYPY